MLVKHIHQKLEDLGVSHDSVIMGDFDYIGEYTAKRRRDPSEENYKKYWHEVQLEFQEEFGVLIISILKKSKTLKDVRTGFLKYLNLATLYNFAIEKGIA